MIFLLLLSLTQVFAFDELQDSDFEKRVHSIYKSHYSSPVTEQEWAGFMSKIEDNEYMVRSGDTLWDLSQVFFADGLYWSKLWSVNEKITNPHLIHVGAKIRFFSGSLTAPPGVEVSDQEKIQESLAQGSAPPGMEAVMATDKAGVNPKGLYPGAPSIPPPRDSVKPVPRSLPGTFKEVTDSVNKYDKQGISLDVRPPLVISSRFIPHSFLYPGVFTSYPNTGKVVEVEDGEEIAGSNRYIYVQSDKGYSVGSQFTIIGKDYSFQKGLTIGEVIQYKGVAQVTEALEDGRYRARVVRAINPINVGAWISDEPIPSLSNDNNGRPKSIRSEIIGGAYENARAIFANGDIIFLGSGSGDGLSVGDILGVYKNRDRRYSNNKTSESPKPIGHLKVFRTDSSVASAFIFQASEAIIIGDRTGAAVLVSSQSSAGEKLDLDSIEGGLDFEESSTETSQGDSLEDELEEDTL